MKRYKLIGTQENWPSFTPGEIYDADYISDHRFPTCTVQKHTEYFTNDWELVEEFTLPEQWYIIRTSDNYEEINKWAKTKSTENFDNASGEVFYLNGVSSTITKDHEGYTEITFEQFEKYVLMKDTKEIIGYKLKEDCKQYLEAALTISKTIGDWGNSLMLYDISISQNYYIDKLIEAKVLDLWFEPVYKETKTLPEINGYKGEITQISGIVKYGCAQLSSKGIESFLKNRAIGVNREINSITLDSGVEVTIEQLKQIVDYFKD